MGTLVEELHSSCVTGSATRLGYQHAGRPKLVTTFKKANTVRGMSLGELMLENGGMSFGMGFKL